ncbi:heme exporter protein CcmB [Candidatus Methylospira mobilis]|uniref:Heme exporter protein B n=1 Tax=Candidatus Methylospira mobilis TaxID=1808979 RepID=A0A5Q0BHN6_9GAMM|nr:heme exporter protein CcmB [Candidatus Methylospira mobilis]QFY41638.1 heme exporter protein CcmB [Candidatus Methylospira mobilis]WNV05111.1 heme exporter protein CcmB [Candidatus Methylospira mobilis]
MNGLVFALWTLVRRDLLLAFRHRGELANPLLFFLMIVSLYPLGVSPEVDLLRRIAPGVIWIAALLAALFSLENLFRSDYEDGTLEQMLLGVYPVPLLVIAKILTHWLVSALPMLLLAPLLGVLLSMPPAAIAAMELTLLLGTPVLSFVGAFGVALTLGLRRGGILLTLLVMPLYIPVLIFATNAITAASAGLPIEGQIYFLAAMALLALTLTPLAIAAALRISVS